MPCVDAVGLLLGALPDLLGVEQNQASRPTVPSEEESGGVHGSQCRMLVPGQTVVLHERVQPMGRLASQDRHGHHVLVGPPEFHPH